MKVQVTLKVPSKAQPPSVFALAIFAKDKVVDVKERIAEAQTLPFQGQELIFEGKVLADDQNLIDYGVKEGSSLEFVVKATETAFVQQVSTLLPGRSLSVDELALLYSHKYGVSANDALHTLGFTGSLHEFLSAQKTLKVVQGCVEQVRQQTNLHVALKLPASSAWADYNEDTSAVHSLDLVVGEHDTVSSIKARAAAAAKVPQAYPELQLSLKGKVLADETRLQACELQDGSSVELFARASAQSLCAQLVDLLKAQAGEMPVDELGLLYTFKYGLSVDQVASTLTTSRRRRNPLPDFLGQHKGTFSVQRGFVSLVQEDLQLSTKAASGHEQCLQIDERISSREFRTKMTRALSGLVATLMEATFMSIHHVVMGGSVGNGTAVEGSAEDAEVTLFLQDVPQEAGRETWAPAILETLSDWLRERLLESVEVIEIRDQALHVAVESIPVVEIRLSPVFDTHAKALDVIASQSKQTEAIYTASLAEQQVRFIKKQPESVKVTARLLKWWRSQRQWSSKTTRPSNQMLEFLAVHVAGQLPSNGIYDQEAALKLAATVMGNFHEIAVTWPANFYGKHVVPEAVLSQRPLLMDPMNPFSNVADPASFDAQEMMAHVATSPHLIS